MPNAASAACASASTCAGVRYVGRHADRLGAGSAQGVDGLRELVGVDVREYELHAERRALVRERAAKAAARAGDHRHLAREFEHSVTPSLSGGLPLHDDVALRSA
ncbi:hypothetical protein OKW38_002052 [Paraburkholderia sp. MM5496-R1]